jgi:hypothetical protein
MQHGLFLRDLGDDRNLFCSLTAAEVDGGELAVMGQLGRSLKVAGVTSGGAPALGMMTVTTLEAGTPPSSSSAREGFTQRVVNVSSGG